MIFINIITYAYWVLHQLKCNNIWKLAMLYQIELDVQDVIKILQKMKLDLDMFLWPQDLDMIKNIGII